MYDAYNFNRAKDINKKAIPDEVQPKVENIEENK